MDVEPGPLFLGILNYLALGLASEAGEVAGKIKKVRVQRIGGRSMAQTIDKIEERLYRIEFLLESLIKLRRQTIQSPWLTADEAGEYLSMNPHVLRRKARQGKIRYYRNPGTRKMWFHVNDLNAYIRGFVDEEKWDDEEEKWDEEEEKWDEEKVGARIRQSILTLYPGTR